jgi:Ran GTPase-activating protein 1
MSSKVFSLEGKSLKLDNAEDIAPHIETLRNNADVEEALFLGNTLGVGACEELASVLASKKNLKVINLADIFTSRLLSEIPPSIDVLLKACLQLPNLHTINLNDNAFGLNTVEPLLSFLSQHTPLEHLYLNNNGMGPIAGNKIGEALATLGEKKEEAGAKPLRTIVCGRNRLENGSMPGWVKAFKANPGITSIRMVQNGIRQEGISLLLQQGLKHVKGIEVFDLEDNTFTSMGSKALAGNVSSWGNLQELALNDCYLSAKGWAMVVDGLKTANPTKLKVIKAQFNNINAKGLEQLADTMHLFTGLQRIELNGNRFNEDDVNITRIREAFEERKEKIGSDDDKEWGLDELDELDDEESDEDEEAEEAEEKDDEEETEVKRADEAEAENVALEQDSNVDKLADLLGKTEIS